LHVEETREKNKRHAIRILLSHSNNFDVYERGINTNCLIASRHAITTSFLTIRAINAFLEVGDDLLPLEFLRGSGIALDQERCQCLHPWRNRDGDTYILWVPLLVR
jgi:hypothetical protein